MTGLVLFLLLTVFSTTFGTLLRSKKYIKADSEPFAYPIGVCYPKKAGQTLTSIKLECKEECAPPVDNEQECDRNVMAYHYSTADCSGSVSYYDRFTEADRRDHYPFNCWEDAELDGGTVNDADYDQNYMIIKLSLGMMTTEIVNGTEEEVCVRDESKRFYKTFPAITNQCVKGFEGRGTNKKWYWYNAACNEDAAYLERWGEFNCTGNQTGIFPLYKPNGCDKRQWNHQNYYSEVLTCSHPDYTIGAGFRNGGNSIIAIAFIFIIAVLY